MNPSENQEAAQETNSGAQNYDPTSEQGDSSDKNDTETAQQARDLVKHLIILIESARPMYHCKEDESSVKAVMKELDEVCQIATSNLNLATHKSLRMLPISWFDSARYVDDVLRELRGLQQELTRLQNKIKDQNSRVNDAATQPSTRENEDSHQQETHENVVVATSGADDHKDSHAGDPDGLGTYDDKQPEPARDIWQMAQNQALDELEKTENELKQLDYLRDRARRHYTEEVTAFLRATHSTDLKDSKTDFDRLHFIKQAEFTTELEEAEARVGRHKETARRLGALLFEDQASNSGDLSDGGYQDVSRCGDDSLWELKYEEIGDWAVLDPREEPGGKLIKAFEDGIQPDLDDLNENTKRRKMIDDWQGQHEKLRRSMVFRELHWWKVFSGI